MGWVIVRVWHTKSGKEHVIVLGTFSTMAKATAYRKRTNKLYGYEPDGEYHITELREFDPSEGV